MKPFAVIDEIDLAIPTTRRRQLVHRWLYARWALTFPTTQEKVAVDVNIAALSGPVLANAACGGRGRARLCQQMFDAAPAADRIETHLGCVGKLARICSVSP
ncbi:hypothetical protein A5650_20660 [Mycobacterium sp. 1164985.4]|nr:hypothetical protein A5650_20660 [Mycobacterium sp. 1164985.4]